MNVTSVAKSVLSLAQAQQSKAASAVPEKDPTNAGTVTPPAHPDGDDPSKTGLPSQQKPVNKDNGTDIPGNAAGKPGGAGENAPSPAKTVQAGSEKTAGALAGLGASLRHLASADHSKSAAAPAAAAPAPAAAAAPASPKSAAAPAGAATDAPAGIDQIYVKIASELAATEEGRALLASHLERRLGQEVARDLLKSAAEAHAVEQEQLVKLAAAQEAHGLFVEVLCHSIEKRASTKRDDTWKKAAAEAHLARLDAIPQLNHPLLKAAYAQGVDDAGAMVGAEGDVGALPGSEGTQINPEEIIALIQQMVESGEITAEEAQQILTELGAQGGAPAGGEGAPAEGPSDEEIAKMPPAEKAAALATRAITKYASRRETELKKPASTAK